MSRKLPNRRRTRPDPCPRGRRSGLFRPRLEFLEDRIQPGETIGLGLSSLPLGGLTGDAFELCFRAERADRSRLAPPALVSLLDAPGTVAPVRLPDQFVREGSPPAPADSSASARWIAESGPLAGPGDEAAHWQGLPAAPASAVPPGNVAGAAFVIGAPFSLPGQPLSVLSPAGRESGGKTHSLATVAVPLPLRLPELRFDTATNELVLRADAGAHTVHETLAPDGFLDVSFDGRRHSSNPASEFFNAALAGATDTTLAGIRFDGGGQDTLMLDSQNAPGSLTVHASGAKVVTKDVAVAGSLVVQASQITVSGALRGEAVALASAGWVSVQAAGRIAAGQGVFGGRIDVRAETFANSGQLHADGLSGGHVVVQAGNILNAGGITADGDTGGGAVRLAFTGSYIGTTAAGTSASSGAAGNGGRVTVDGGATGRLYSSGSHRATAATGGTIDLLGREVVLAGATVDASGQVGGGTVRVGGDFQGRNPAVGDAPTVTVTSATTIRADARRRGGGGRVIVWADQATAFTGTVSARGSAGGAGGFIEVSSKGGLNYGGTADAGAVAGKPGTLLLEPKNLVIDASAGVFPQFNLIDPHPTAGGGFGAGVTVLGNGNVVVNSPKDNFGGTNAGAVYLFDGLTGALRSSLVGSNPDDQVGLFSVIVLSNGNYVVPDPFWHDNRGAATWGDGSTGVSGPVSDANSLIGSNPGGPGDGDFVGARFTALSNGNYVVRSPFWNGNRGAATWGDGTKGVIGTVTDANSLVGSDRGDQVGFFGTPLSSGDYVIASPLWNVSRGAVTWGSGGAGVSGPVADANSLVGSHPNDLVGTVSGFSGVVPLSNGNYLVRSPYWNANRGAVTWGSGSTGVSGPVAETNSLVGSDPNEQLGFGVTLLSNGNYVVVSPLWNGQRGAATWGSADTGISGTISDANSLVGDSPGDQVGYVVTALSNDNYVVGSPYWNGNRGAATWGDGSTGITGTVTDANSLVGSIAEDPHALSFGVIALSNGNYVVDRRSWNGNRGAVTWGSGSTGVIGTISDANSLIGTHPHDLVGDRIFALSNGNYVVLSEFWNSNRGAATWGNGSTGVSGSVSEANSLVGDSPGDVVGASGIALSNGNYVVRSPAWNSGRGAVTWGSGDTGIIGTISNANSLVGSSPGDHVGSSGVFALSNGNYVASSPDWDGGRGAATWGSGSTGVKGPISDADSLAGSSPGDHVGAAVIALSNGNYLVRSEFWNGNRGAVTWGSGSTGVSGTVSDANSLVGTHPGNPGDRVGLGRFTPLTNGNFVVPSQFWNGGRGAVTWGNGSTGVRGTVSDANSVVGSTPGDQVGAFGVTALSNGNYVVRNPFWNGNRGAATWVSGTTGRTLDGHGTVTPQNSLMGTATNAGLGPVIDNPTAQTFLAPFVTEAGGRVTAGLVDPNRLTYALGQGQTLTISPDFLNRTLSLLDWA